MEQELVNALLRYLASETSMRELGHCLDWIDIWNGWQDGDLAIERLRDIVGDLQLLVTDVSEGLRDEGELRALIASRLPDLAAPPYPEGLPVLLLPNAIQLSAPLHAGGLPIVGITLR